MAIEAVLLDGRRHAVVVLSGRADSGFDHQMIDSLQVSRRCHTVVDLRQLSGMTPEVVKALLAALGTALDRNRTMRVVVRDHLQHQVLRGVGIGTMMPVHLSISDAMNAVDEAVANAQAAVAPALH